MTSALISVVALPIGNKDDLSPRARHVLKTCDLIAAEDTRRAKDLLQALEIPLKPLMSYFDENEEERTAQLIKRLLSEHLHVALISDCGTPCVSDPGYRLIKAAHAHQITVTPICGPSALTALWSVSGIPNHKVTFVGFLPTKEKALTDECLSWQSLPGSVIFFEAARRLLDSLNIIAQHYPEAHIAIGRELSKTYEECRMFPIDAALKYCQTHPTLKGEVVCMIDIGSRHPSSQKVLADPKWQNDIKKCLDKGLSVNDILGLYAEGQLLNVPKKQLYRSILDLKNNRT